MTGQSRITRVLTNCWLDTHFFTSLLCPCVSFPKGITSCVVLVEDTSFSLRVARLTCRCAGAQDTPALVSFPHTFLISRRLALKLLSKHQSRLSLSLFLFRLLRSVGDRLAQWLAACPLERGGFHVGEATQGLATASTPQRRRHRLHRGKNYRILSQPWVDWDLL